jgi:hypothetical protein
VLGVGRFEAKERSDVFRRHNVQSMEAILPHWQDMEARTKLAISSRDQLEKQMEDDRKSIAGRAVRGWHSEPPPDPDPDPDNPLNQA